MEERVGHCGVDEERRRDIVDLVDEIGWGVVWVNT
jgi:hypothetical protein